MLVRRRLLPLIAMTGALCAGPARGDERARVHEVRPGESLWTIAANATGDARMWPAIYRANRDQIKDPALLYPGQRLTIPPIDPAARAELRREALELQPR